MIRYILLRAIAYDFTLREPCAQYHTRERVHDSQYDVTVFLDEAALEWCLEQSGMIQHKITYIYIY